MKHILNYILLLLGFSVYAQTGKIQTDTLETVYLFNWKSIFTTPDSLYIFNNTRHELKGRLAETLLDHTSFQIREYGRGMTAGISIRGSSPSHVQILWNGMPLNSPFNGQTDLNTLTPELFRLIRINKGGASVFYGSGAVAGSVSLENPAEFTNHFHAVFKYSGSQFGNINPTAIVQLSNGKHFLKTGIYYQKDKNHYIASKYHFINENAEIFKNDYLLDYSFKHRHHLLGFHVYNSFTDRNLPPTLTTSSRAKLIDLNYRYALDYQYTGPTYRLNLQAAQIKEIYRYFHHINLGIAGEGTAVTRVFKTAVRKQITPGIKLYIEAEYNRISGKTRNFDEKIINEEKFLGGLQYNLKTNSFHTGIRKNISTYFNLPWVYFLQWQWKPFKFYQINTAITKNYKIPTFNDMFWIPGGNPDLLPETNTEWELTQMFSKNGLYMQFDIYYKHARNLIKWRPGKNGFWSPENIQSVTAHGFEWGAGKIFNTPSFKVSLKGEISYNRVLDDQTGKQLIYTPLINAFMKTSFTYSIFSLYYSFRYQSHYYTDPQHYSMVNGHHLHHIGLEYHFKNIVMLFEIKNLFNTYYELMPSHPMPGRQFSWNIKYQINKNLNYEKQNF